MRYNILKILKEKDLVCYLMANPHVIFSRTSYLFILSHMRSRSSVLAHVLGSNPGICGYCETHRSYITSTDLVRMKIDMHKNVTKSLNGKYLLDKILHNNLKVSDDILHNKRVRIIILIRPPASTIASIIKMGYITAVDWYKQPEKASEYYCSRLAELTRYGEKLRGKFFVIDSDAIINETDCVLNKLSIWLGLNNSLDKFYRKFSNTGEPGYGDPSENIKTGVIMKTPEHSDVNIPNSILEEASFFYEGARSKLFKLSAYAR